MSLAQQVLKKIVRFASAFPSPPFRSSDFAGLRRPRLYGFHTGTRSLSNRKGRGRRRGGREREPRRAGEGRLVWNRNSCVLIDYRLWAAKSEGRPWVDHCINLYVHHCLSHCIDHHPEPRSGLCPELLADFRIPKPPGCSQGAQRAVFFAVRVADFLAEGAGWGASPGRGGELGCQAQQVLKKFVRLASAFPSPPTRSLSNRKGRGRRSGGREREPRRAGEAKCMDSNTRIVNANRLGAAEVE